MDILKKKHIWITVVLCVITSITSFCFAYYFNVKQNDIQAENKEESLDNTALLADAAVASAAANIDNKITPSTKITYQYYYEEDKRTEEVTEEPPYFLIDMPKDDLQKYFQDWQIVSFSPLQVVMRKTVEGKSQQRYIVSVYEGYVAVFYEEDAGGNGLRELTDTPVSSLSPEEQDRLNKGIPVVGDDSLMKILEDYDS